VRDIIIFWIIYRLVNVLCDYLTHLTAKTKNTFDDQLVPLVRKSLKVFTVIIGVIFILQNNGVNVTAFITGLGIGGLAFALAAKDTLANLFGSVTIFLDRPFGIGDWIKAGDAEGIVEEVGFRSTRIRTFYNSQISVPNSVMANAEIDNLGRRQYRRVYTMLNLTYDTPPKKIEAFTEGIKAIIRANPKMRQDYYEVHFNNFGAHSLDILVYAFFRVPDWSEELQQKHHFFLQIVRLAADLGVDFAFPTQTLHIATQAEATKLPEKQNLSEDEMVEKLMAYDRDSEKSKLSDHDLKDKNGNPISIKSGS
jgi:MscS family membrane protein